MSDETVVTEVDPMVALLAAAKTYLQITWTDEETDARLTQLILTGKDYLNNKCSEEMDYSTPGVVQTLLFEFVRYGRDGALDVFENNYRSLILALQHERMVTVYVSSETDTV